MPRRTLNLGILAHVDAGKTTLTERLLFTAGVIDELGSVDDGSTQTDSLALERERGITIKAAVVSFAIDDVTVNLIDTPGHPDFIAEVERVLSVLDGAVLVISAVEGVQPQTRILMRALQRLRTPTLLFVNKIDRAGATDELLLAAIAERLTPAIVPMGDVDGLGTRAVRFTPWRAGEAAHRGRLTELLAERNESILAAYLEGDGIPSRRLRAELAAQTHQAVVHPVFFGSAITGAGIEAFMTGITELLPATEGDAEGAVSGTVFKIERSSGGQKVAYVRMFAGTVRVRDRLDLGRDAEEKVTAIGVFSGGSIVSRASVSAGEIGALRGLRGVQIGDAIGRPRRARAHHFAQPTLETVVAPTNPGDKAALRLVLTQLAEQDPLIGVRQGGDHQELSVSLYGEVQKEVIQETLARDYGLEVTFHETTTICIERPLGTGEAIEVLNAESNPFSATIGLRIERGHDGSGIAFRLRVDPRTTPLYLYKTVESFAESMDRYIRHALREGLFGWQVADCLVTMTKCTYSVPDGPPSRRGPRSTAADFRKLTPLVAMQALERAGAVVCEPMLRVSLEIPTETVGSVMSAASRFGGLVELPASRGRLSTIETVLSAAQLRVLQRQLPGLTGGEGVLESDVAGYQPVTGKQPTRRRTTANPLNRKEYLLRVKRTC